MGQGEGIVQQASSAALRERSLERLQRGFGDYVEAEANALGWDPRDAMINITPFIDCARRLGFDPAVVLGPIATTGPAWFKETFEAFVGRTDITLEAFGWSIVHTPNGPRYSFDWPA